MLKTNKEKVIRTTTADAFKALPTSTDENDLGASYPKTSLDTLSNPLRGIGPATASLILSIATSHTDPDREVPFYSDDTYLWLCLEVYPFAQDNERRTKRLVKHRKPNGELNVKYNMHEYRDLWDAVWELRLRLNKLAGSQKAKEKGLKEVSSMDIEKVAFVIRHIRVSGFPVELEEVVEEVIVPPKPEKRSKSKSEGKKDKKRKREDGGEGGEKEKRKKKQRY